MMTLLTYNLCGILILLQDPLAKLRGQLHPNSVRSAEQDKYNMVLLPAITSL